MKGVLTPLLRARRTACGSRAVSTSRRPAPVILAANHRSFLDSMFLPLVIRRRVTFVAKAEYFDSKKTAWFFRAVGQIPIRREGGSASEGALRRGDRGARGRRRVRHLPGGHAHARRRTRTRATPASPASRMRTGAPIVPVGLVGTDECQPTDKKLPRLFEAVHDPLRAADLAGALRGRDGDALALRQLTDEVMFEIVSSVRLLRVPRHLRDEAGADPRLGPVVGGAPDGARERIVA